MSRFTENLRVIPKGAWRIAALLYVLLVAVMFAGPMRHEKDFLQWPMSLSVAFALLAPIPVCLYTLLAGFVYGDAKRRGMRHVMWTWLSLIPYFIGVAAYFILRDPLPKPCPGCQKVSLGSFAFCPHCGAALRPHCPQCGKAVEHGWTNCAHCGVKLPAGEPRTAMESRQNSEIRN